MASGCSFIDPRRVSMLVVHRPRGERVSVDRYRVPADALLRGAVRSTATSVAGSYSIYASDETLATGAVQ